MRGRCIPDKYVRTSFIHVWVNSREHIVHVQSNSCDMFAAFASWSAPIHKVSSPWPGCLPNSVTTHRPCSPPLTAVAIGWSPPVRRTRSPIRPGRLPNWTTGPLSASSTSSTVLVQRLWRLSRRHHRRCCLPPLINGATISWPTARRTKWPIWPGHARQRCLPQLTNARTGSCTWAVTKPWPKRRGPCVAGPFCGAGTTSRLARCVRRSAMSRRPFLRRWYNSWPMAMDR
jgi:hypothetical protein